MKVNFFSALCLVFCVFFVSNAQAKNIWSTHGNTKTLAILIPPIEAQPSSLKALARFLYHEGLDVVIVELNSRHNWTEWIQPVLSVVEQGQSTYTHVYICGVGTGSLLAFYASQTHHLEKCVVISPYYTGYTRTSKILNIAYPLLAPLKQYLPPQKIEQPPEVAPYFEAQMSFSHFIELCSLKRQVIRQLAHIKGDVLLLQSSHDFFASPQSADAFFKRLTQAKKSCIYTGQDQRIGLVNDPNLFNYIVDFFNAPEVYPSDYAYR